MNLMKIRLERAGEALTGDPRHGYEFVALPTPEGHIDAAEWMKQNDKCRVRYCKGAQTVQAGVSHCLI